MKQAPAAECVPVTAKDQSLGYIGAVAMSLTLRDRVRRLHARDAGKARANGAGASEVQLRLAARHGAANYDTNESRRLFAAGRNR